ncbi:unnamed protein product [Rotaria sp. Silwood1]|nr:unnamed protein product [Rotaria sp. Silwood1]CAF4632352.1 unnamed protein product [Rotaria sp. Silwood1]
MSINRRAAIDAFIERQLDKFHQLIHHLTLYYNNTRLHFSFLSEKTNQRYLYLSILITFILLTIIFLIIFEYRRLLKYIQKIFQLIYSYKENILIKIRKKFLQKTTPSLINILLNSNSHIRKKFCNEFVRRLNEEFLNRKEQLSVETLQFANAKIRDVSQTNNNNNSETPAEKIIINAVLDFDHLIVNIINTFREQHFSVETPKLSGQLYILLAINPNQYSIEANLQQLQINPVNIIDPNNTLLPSEKQSIVKLLDETISRTTVRCSFRLSDHQEDTNYHALYNSAFGSYPDSNKPYSSNNQQSSSSVQPVGSRSHEQTSIRYQLPEPPPTLLVNDINPYIYTKESEFEKEPKRLLVRIVKAVKLHDVEQPYCILELNHPKQIKQTDIAKNGLNPFWDERFIFECDEQSNQIRLQIIDRKQTNKRTNNNYIDTVYADVSIPFAYATSTVYKQDIPISPQNPESIIRLEVSPEVRSKHEHIQNNQRQYLPTLKLIKSNSCSDVCGLAQNLLQSESFDDDQIEETKELDNTTRFSSLPLEPREAPIRKKSNAYSLVPMESTGFTIQTSTHSTDCLGASIETKLTNSADKSHESYQLLYTQSSLVKTSFSYNEDKTTSLPPTMLHDWKSQNQQKLHKIEQDYPERYQQSSSNDFLSSSYDAATLPKHYGLPSSLYDDDNGFVSTLPRSVNIHSNTSPLSQSSPLTPRDGGLGHDKPQKSKSFMSSLKHLTLPRRKHRNKDKHDTSMSSHTSSISQLNTSIQAQKTNPVSHSLSSALPGPNPEYFLGNVTDPKPIRRSRSISQSFKNLFRSNSKKKTNVAKADALGEYENGTHKFIVDNPNFLSTSTPTTKKLSFLHRHRSKQKTKEQTNYSANSLSSFDCSRVESVRDTPVRANVGHPVTMTKSIVQ